MEVNYKNKRYYNTAKYPIRQPLVIVGLIWLLSKIVLTDKKYKVEKINMEGLKPPYIKPYDCVDISTENDSFYCYPRQENVVTKLAFATEVLYQRAVGSKTRVLN